LVYRALRRYMLRQSSCHDQGSLHVRRRPKSSTGRRIGFPALVHAYAISSTSRHWIIHLRNEAGLLAAALSYKKGRPKTPNPIRVRKVSLRMIIVEIFARCGTPHARPPPEAAVR